MATVNPIRDIKKIDAIKKILQNSVRDLTLFVFGINLSLRISDILKLNVSNVLDGKGKIRKAITLYEKKTGKPKQFPLNDSITDALKTYLINGKKTPVPDEPLFVSTHGKRLSYSQAWRVIKAAGEAVGLEHIGNLSL